MKNIVDISRMGNIVKLELEGEIGHIWGFSMRRWDYDVDTIVRIPMQSGRNGLVRVVSAKFPSDPNDQYFLKVVEVGYEDEQHLA